VREEESFVRVIMEEPEASFPCNDKKRRAKRRVECY
jgi:hypothetical protein